MGIVIPLSPLLRIFPLAEVVLFPGTLLPLHIFEPRYRKLLADALAGDRTIAMVLIRTDEGTENPPVYSIGCAGTVVEHKSLGDGRSMIVLKGTVRFRIKRELDSTEPYRMVEAQALYDAPVRADCMRRWRGALQVRIEKLVAAAGGGGETLTGLFEKMALEGLVNYLSASLPLDVLEKQSLLECPTIGSRYERLCEIIDFKIIEARTGVRLGAKADC